MTVLNNSQAVPQLTGKLIDRLYRALLLSANPRRDRAILQLFLNFGCTVRDLLTLQMDDVDLDKGRIRWPQEGRRTWHPLTPEAKIALNDYCRRERRSEGNMFFTSRLGHPMSRAQVMQIFRFLQRESGLATLNPRTMRERHRHLLLEAEPVQAWVEMRRKFRTTPAATDWKTGSEGGN